MTGSRQWHTDRSVGVGGFTERLRQRPATVQVVIVAGLVVAAVVLSSVAWITATSMAARGQLTTIRNDLSILRDEIANGDFESAIATAESISAHAGSAHQLTSGPAWWGGSKVPYLGKPIVSIRGIALATHLLALNVLPELVRISSDLQPERMQVSDDQFDLDTLGGLPARLTPVIGSATAIDRGVNVLPAHTWLSTVDYGRDSLAGTIGDLVKFLKDASLAAGIATELLGAHHTQRYFVGFLNDAESRGLGGLPGVFGILQASKGKVTFSTFGTDDKLRGASSGLNLGKDYSALYAKPFNPGTQYLNSSVSPSFDYAARIWAAMYQRKTGVHINGAIALDPTALSYLLKVTGPATLSNGNQITADNVVAATENSAYLKFPDNNTRKNYLVEIAKVVEGQILRQHKNLIGLLKAAGQAAVEHRLLLWSEDPRVEKTLAAESVGGITPQTSEPYGRVVLNNYLPNKLDYYLDSALQWKRTGCGPTRTVTVTVTLTNHAPASGLTPYMTGRPTKDPKSGDTETLLDYHATARAVLKAATVDGRPVTVQSGIERGHPVARLLVSTPRGTSHTVVFTFSEPDGHAAPRVQVQPMVRPMTLDLQDQTCA